MKVAKLPGAKQIDFLEMPIPKASGSDVVLKVNCFGVCGSDIQIYHGLHKYMTFPVVLGHEISADVVEIGENVKGFEVGDRVTMEPQVTCGECYPCEVGRFNVCENLKVMGVHMDGAAAEYFMCDEKYLHKCPKTMSNDLVALVEPLAVGVGAVRRGECYKGGNVAVVGAGTIGNLTAQAAKAMGAANVMITDINQQKLDYAKECGIDFCVNTKNISLKDAIIENFGKRKADIIIDCAATAFTFKSILEAARRNSNVVISGNFKAPVEFEVPLIQRQEIKLIGHMMYVREDFEDAIKYLNEGTIKADKFITQRFKFEDFEESFKFYDEHTDDVMKMLIEL